jgi:hypothetical protein
MENEKTLKVMQEEREAFVLCLTLGTLEAMRCGSWPLESGIWTLAVPSFWEPLEDGTISEEIMDILKTCDELSALESLGEKKYAYELIEKMISLIHLRLASLHDKQWRACWD